MPTQSSLIHSNGSTVTMSSDKAADLIASRTAANFGGFGFVYALESTCGTRVKVGRSSVPHERLRTLAYQAGGAGRSTIFGPFKDARAAERTLHEVFSRKRGEGEWFAVAYEAVTEVIDLCTKQVVTSEPPKLREDQRAADETLSDKVVDVFFDRFYQKQQAVERADDVSDAARTFNALHAVALTCGLTGREAADAANVGTIKQTGVDILTEMGATERNLHASSRCGLSSIQDQYQYHLQNYANLADFTPDLIRTDVLNDANDTLVFRAQDVCAAIGALDYYAAMLVVDPDEVVMFTHPDTDALGMSYACVTRAGFHQLLDSIRGVDGPDPGAITGRARRVHDWVVKQCDAHDKEAA